MIHFFIIIFCGLTIFNAQAALPVKATLPKIEHQKTQEKPAQKARTKKEDPKESEKSDKQYWKVGKSQIQHQHGYFD